MPRTIQPGTCLILAAIVCACGGHEKPGSASPIGHDSGDSPAAPAADSGSPVAGDGTPEASKGAAGTAAAASGKGGSKAPLAGSPAPLTGATDFSSADPNAGNSSGGAQRAGAAGAAASGDAAAAPATTAPNAGMQASTRMVERGDIYSVLGDKRILNLNAYRGLQVIDISDVNAPKIEGRLAVAGTPLEMYVVGERAIVLLNDWRGYYGARDDVKVESVQGGVVLNVDIRDRAQPKLLSQAVLRGNISTSRLTQGDGQSALYVAANVTSNAPPYTNTTLIKSYDVSGDGLGEKSEIDLGGYVQDVQATTNLMLVSSIDYTKSQQSSQVALIDISRPDGTMVRGGSVRASGVVENKFNMDAYNGVLRVVSGASWSGTRENHLETFSLADLAQPKALDHCTFAAGDMLYATVFIENKGFFVTYLRKDPFHAFSIDDRGRCAEHNQYIVSGWNDFLRPTLSGTRLIGVGSNDENSRRTVSVSLYDTTNLDNPQPMLARADLTLDSSYSEAQWDDRAFSVIEGALDVKAADGTHETGLVLVPYQGYEPKSQRYVAQVQILTFSNRTLTRRGVMDHGSSVRRAFLAGDFTAANLSDEELRLFEISDPNAPQARGKLEVAPNYRELFVYGDYVARLHDPSYYFGWSGNPNVTPPAAHVELVPRASDLDITTPVAEIAVPSNGSLVQVGKLLVSVVSQTEVLSGGVKQGSQVVYHTRIQVFDLSDPTQPKARGTLETDRLQPYAAYYPAVPGGVIADCFDCNPGWRGAPSHYVLGDDVLVFAAAQPQQKSLGIVHRCWEYPQNGACEMTRNTGGSCDQYVSGGVNCATYKDGKKICSGEFYKCDADSCEVIEEKIPTITNCSDGEEFRSWQSYGFDALDLADPDQPVLAKRVEMDKADEGTSLLAAGSALYFNYQHPLALNDDPRAFVKRYFKRVDFADPQAVDVGPAINVPGDVIAADGGTIYTRDLIWEDSDTRTSVARLTVDKDLAYLQANRVFSERSVSTVKLDGTGHMLVSSDPVYSAFSRSQVQEPHRLSILDAQSLEIAGEADVDAWATFVDAGAGHALFSVSGGLLVFNVEDAAKPVAQAYFPTVAWPDSIYFDGHEAMFAGGPYGIYRFDADVFNLLKK